MLRRSSVSWKVAVIASQGMVPVMDVSLSMALEKLTRNDLTPEMLIDFYSFSTISPELLGFLKRFTTL